MPKVILPTPPALPARTILGGIAPAGRRGSPRAKPIPAWQRAAPRRAETPRSPEVELAILYHRHFGRPTRKA